MIKNLKEFLELATLNDGSYSGFSQNNEGTILSYDNGVWMKISRPIWYTGHMLTLFARTGISDYCSCDEIKLVFPFEKKSYNELMVEFINRLFFMPKVLFPALVMGRPKKFFYTDDAKDRLLQLFSSENNDFNVVKSNDNEIVYTKTVFFKRVPEYYLSILCHFIDSEICIFTCSVAGTTKSKYEYGGKRNNDIFPSIYSPSIITVFKINLSKINSIDSFTNEWNRIIVRNMLFRLKQVKTCMDLILYN